MGALRAYADVTKANYSVSAEELFELFPIDTDQELRGTDEINSSLSPYVLR